MRHYPTRRVSKKRSAMSLTLLLYGCTPQRLRQITAAELAGSYSVTPVAAEKMLADARKGRGV